MADKKERLWMNLSEPKTLTFDLGITPKDDAIVEEYERKQRLLEEDSRYERYKTSGVPSKFFDTSIESYVAVSEEEKRNKASVEEFARNPSNRIFILCGKNGNGKSHLGCGAVRECGGVYVTSSNLCIEYDAATSYHSKRTREEIISYYSNRSGVVVIDECGKYTLNPELEKFLLALILCARYENNRPTWFITNASKKGFVEFLGKSVFDRLTEVCTTLEFNGESKRKLMRKIVSS